MNQIVMSTQYQCFCHELARYGYDVLPTDDIKLFHEPERRHVDMQLLIINGRRFSLKDCRDKPLRDYPGNVRLNCLYFGGKLYGRLDAVDSSVLVYCRENGIETFNVNQGYTRCSTLVVNDSAAVTADKSIEKALKANGAEVLLIKPGHIRLEGFESGFIGGAGFCDGGTAYFFGDITKHPDYEKIRVFCEKHGKAVQVLCNNEPLTDIGGAVVL